MSDSVLEQKLLIVDGILDLRKKIDAIEYILVKAKEPEGEIAIEFFDELFEFLYLLLWESTVVNISWLYEENWRTQNGKRVPKKQTRSLYWYLEEQKKSGPLVEAEVEGHLKSITGLKDKIIKVRAVRDKWLAHRDVRATGNPQEFIRSIGLKLEDVQILIETAHEIVQKNFPTTDLTQSGIHKLFWIVEFPYHLPDEIEKIKRFRKPS
jgi:hypothetical protein